MPRRNPDNTILDDIKDYWLIILFIIGMIVNNVMTTTSQASQIQQVKAEADGNTIAVEQVTTSINTLNTNMYLICNNLSTKCKQ